MLLCVATTIVSHKFTMSITLFFIFYYYFFFFRANGEPATVAEGSALRQFKEPDASFLLEVAALPMLISKVSTDLTFKLLICKKL